MCRDGRGYIRQYIIGSLSNQYGLQVGQRFKGTVLRGFYLKVNKNALMNVVVMTKFLIDIAKKYLPNILQNCSGC